MSQKCKLSHYSINQVRIMLKVFGINITNTLNACSLYKIYIQLKSNKANEESLYTRTYQQNITKHRSHNTHQPRPSSEAKDEDRKIKGKF